MHKTQKAKDGAATRGMNHNRLINHHQLITKQPDTESERVFLLQSLASLREREREREGEREEGLGNLNWGLQ